MYIQSVSSGEFLGLLLGILISGWLFLDLVVWLLGYQTLSQWVIREGTKRLTFVLGTLLLIIGTASLLIWHFELIPLLMCHLGIGACVVTL